MADWPLEFDHDPEGCPECEEATRRADMDQALYGTATLRVQRGKHVEHVPFREAQRRCTCGRGMVSKATGEPVVCEMYTGEATDGRWWQK